MRVLLRILLAFVLLVWCASRPVQGGKSLTRSSVRYYGEGVTSIASTADPATKGNSWVISIRNKNVRMETIDWEYERRIKHPSLRDRVAKTRVSCTMGVSHGPEQTHIALTCPDDATALEEIVADMKNVYGKGAVTTVKNDPVQLPPIYTVATSTSAIWSKMINTSQSLYTVRARTETQILSVPWGLDRIKTRVPLYDSTYIYDNTGHEADVYVIDTGVRISHTEFEGRAIWLGNTIDGLNMDCSGHGTHVAGTVAAKTYGVAKKARIIAVKVLDCTGGGTRFSVKAGMNMALENKHPTRASIINLSLNTLRDEAFDNDVLLLLQRGFAIAVASGNSNEDACLYSPSGMTQLLSTIATDQNDNIASFSNHGPCTRIGAPGVSIISTWHTSDVAVNVISGTSMACPHVAGQLAVLWSLFSNKQDPVPVMNALVANATRNIIKKGVMRNFPPLLYGRLVLPSSGSVMPTPTAPTASPLSPPALPDEIIEEDIVDINNTGLLNTTPSTLLVLVFALARLLLY